MLTNKLCLKLTDFIDNYRVLPLRSCGCFFPQISIIRLNHTWLILHPLPDKVNRGFLVIHEEKSPNETDTKEKEKASRHVLISNIHYICPYMSITAPEWDARRKPNRKMSLHMKLYWRQLTVKTWLYIKRCLLAAINHSVPRWN